MARWALPLLLCIAGPAFPARPCLASSSASMPTLDCDEMDPELLSLWPLLKWSRLAAGSEAGLVEALKAANSADRWIATVEAARRGSQMRARLLELLCSSAQPVAARLHAAIALETMWTNEVRRALLEVLAAESPELVRLGADLFSRNGRRGDAEAEEALVKLLTHADLAVRRAAALAAGKVGQELAADSLANLLKFDDASDGGAFRQGLVLGLERLGTLGLERLLTLAESDRDQDRERVVAAFELLTSADAFAMMPRLLANPHLSDAQTEAVLRSRRNFRFDKAPPSEPTLAWLIEHPNAGVGGKVAALEGLEAANALQSPTAQGLLIRLLQDDADENVRAIALRAAKKLKLRSAAKLLQEQLTRRDRSAAEQRAMIAALVDFRAHEAVPLLKSLLGAPEAKSLHDEAWRAIGMLAPEAEGSAFAIGQLRAPGRQPCVEMILIAGRSEVGAREVARLFAADALPANLKQAVLEALGKSESKVARQCAALKRLLEQPTQQIEPIKPNGPPEGALRAGSSLSVLGLATSRRRECDMAKGATVDPQTRFAATLGAHCGGLPTRSRVPASARPDRPRRC